MKLKLRKAKMTLVFCSIAVLGSVFVAPAAIAGPGQSPIVIHCISDIR